jgi:aryl-alcohol dehydrogenase-like predicted oxidoreductase
MRHAARMKGAPALTSTDLYRFVLSNPGFDMVLAGPKTIAHLEGALKAVELGPFGKDEYGQLCKLGDALYAGK